MRSEEVRSSQDRPSRSKKLQAGEGIDPSSVVVMMSSTLDSGTRNQQL